MPSSIASSTSTSSTSSKSTVSASSVKQATPASPTDATPDSPVSNSQRCRYPNKVCMNQRAHKSNGALHRFCEYHRHKANQHQKRWQQRRLNAKRFYDDNLSDKTAAVPTTRTTKRKASRSSAPAAQRPQAASLTIASPVKKQKLECHCKSDLAGSVSPSTPGELIDDVDWLDLSALLAVPSKADVVSMSAPVAVKDVFSHEDLLPVTWAAFPEPTPLYPNMPGMLPECASLNVNLTPAPMGVPPMVWML